MFPLFKTGETINKSGGRIHLVKRHKGRVVKRLSEQGVSIHLYDQYPCFADSFTVKSAKVVVFNREILDCLGQASPLAKELFQKLALVFEKSLLAGRGEQVAYAQLAQGLVRLSNKERAACLDALTDPGIDPGSVFREFCQAALLADEKEQARLIALLKARALTDIPYDRERALDVERRFESDLPALRRETLKALASTYDPGVDQRNAENVFKHCLAKNKRLLVCRFGRAFYTDALLIADSRGIRGREIAKETSAISRAFQELRRLDGAENVGPEQQRVVNLAAKEWFSVASMEGALEKLKDGLRRLETSHTKKSDQARDLAGIEATRTVIDAFRTSIFRLEDRMGGAPAFEPAFVAFLSRIHELDAVNIVRVNELLDPFFGEDPKMEALITSTGLNTTISPNPHAWLPYASDWVEALPAHAHYTIVPTEGGGYEVLAVTEREVLEIIYKTCADDWATNIRDVMDRENVAVARHLVAEKYGARAMDEAGIIRFIQAKGKVEETANIAYLVELTAERECRRVAVKQEAGDSRFTALLEVCADLEWNANELVSNERVADLQSMVLEKQRDLPNAHVLTTLGPTETETSITNWLEEAMTLFLIEGNEGLGPEVQARISSYRQLVGDIALQVIEDEEMEGELLRMLGDSELKDEPANRARVAVSLVTMYPEIANTVNSLIAEKLQVLGPFTHCLRDYVGPLSTFTARRDVIKEKGLAPLLDDGRYRYSSSGPYKRYNLAYTPSRVDLGPEIIESVRNVPKWVGGDGNAAAQGAKSLYSLFNAAGVTAVNRPQIAEFLKVGENFFTRGGVYYLSLTAAANLNALGVGDFEFLRGEWNQRGDRTVLPTGETYGGFCVPKEFSLLFSIVTRALNPKTVDEILDAFGIPRDESLRSRLMEDLLQVLRMRRKASDQLTWEDQARAFLNERYGAAISRLPELTKTLNKAGVLWEDAEIRTDYEIANWKNKKALGLEEINRSGVFDKVRLINVLVKEATKQHPAVQMDRLIGVVGVGYKEDVTDVRFSAGARKLEIFSGLGQHLLQDIDPGGREIYAEALSEYAPPLDLRLVGSCTAKDMFGHVPMNFSSLADSARRAFLEAGYSEQWIATNAREHGVDLENWGWSAPDHKHQVLPMVQDTIGFLVFGVDLGQVSESVRQRFLIAGLTDDTINANALSFGGDIRRWRGLDALARERLLSEVGAAKHVFITEARGIYSKDRYEAALTGADFLDLGIPDKELLDLIDDLPKLISLMKNGEDKPVIFADGTSGARRFGISFRYPTTKEKVKELFALDDQAYYGCMGIGREDIAEWKQEMEQERRDCRVLLTAVLERRPQDAEQCYARIVQRLREFEKDEEAIRQELSARQFQVWKPYYGFVTERISKVLNGLPLAKLDFGTFLVLGGRWLFNGIVSKEEFDQIRADYAFALEQKATVRGMKAILEFCFRPKYVPEEEEYKEVSTGVSGSLKAVEDTVLRLETREIRRQQLEQALRINRRRSAFVEEMERVVRGVDFDHEQALSKMTLADLSEERFGAFLGLTKKVWFDVLQHCVHDGPFKNECLQELDSTFRGGVLLDAEYASLARKGASIFEFYDRNQTELTKIAKALELLDIAFLVEKILYVESGTAVWKAVARFFDDTLNNHIFDYVPYHYYAERTHAFKDWTRRELLRFAVERHSFLHQLILELLRTRSDIASKSEQFKDQLMGKLNGDGDLEVIPIAVNVAEKAEQKWFSYARLRDLSTLVFDGYPLPEIKQDFSIPNGVNVGIVYPIGNTTVSVGLEQNPDLSTEGINVFSVPFPVVVEEGGRKLLKAREIFICDDNGTWFLARLSQEETIHAVWFHFTHFLRPEIEKVQAPLIQPLLWEAGTYLKCALPGMMRGSGYACPGQANWYREQSTGKSRERAKREITRSIRQLAADFKVLIVKAEKESGGRRSKILPVQDKLGRSLVANIDALADLVYDISLTDNVVIQEVIPSKVRRLYTADFLTLLKERFIVELGIGIQDDTPLFSYFRLVVVKGPDKKCRITHRITVVSTAGIANVGQGGRLFEYRDEKIDPKFRQDLREELEGIAIASIKSQETYIQENRKEIIASYLDVHREFSFDQEIVEPHENLLGIPDHEILFEMGDYMPVLLVDDQGFLTRVYDHDDEQFIPLVVEGRPNPKLKILDADGKPMQLPVSLFEDGRKRQLFWQVDNGKKQPVRALTVVKIEPNPGAGLWRPHNDRLKLVGRDGEGVFQIFEVLGAWGKLYKEKIM